MKIPIDFSIFTKESGAFGYVSGEISVCVAPLVGDTVAFNRSGGKGITPPAGFVGHLKVTDRLIEANSEERPMFFALSDVVVDTINDAVQLVDYLASAFDLFSNVYSDV